MNVLTEGMISQNGRAFLIPLIRFEKELNEAGYVVSLFYEVCPELYDCDVLVVESKFYRHEWKSDAEKVLGLFEGFKERVGALVYFDLSDSSGWVHAKPLPYVDAFYKNQALKNRDGYLKSYYGHRPHTDYYYSEYGVVDEVPANSEPVPSRSCLEKIGVGWNSAFGNHSAFGHAAIKLYKKLPMKFLLGGPLTVFEPARKRTINVHYRANLSYQRKTVSYQREKIKKKLGKVNAKKVGRVKYFYELASSKSVVSPFGWGEITLKDFEVFLAGSVLVKPSLNHMDTWPPLYKENKTYVPFRWDMEDFEYVVNSVLCSLDEYIDVARRGQEQYLRYVHGSESGEIFAARFDELIKAVIH